jgi:hypothetical protein
MTIVLQSTMLFGLYLMTQLDFLGYMAVIFVGVLMFSSSTMNTYFPYMQVSSELLEEALLRWTSFAIVGLGCWSLSIAVAFTTDATEATNIALPVCLFIVALMQLVRILIDPVLKSAGYRMAFNWASSVTRLNPLDRFHRLIDLADVIGGFCIAIWGMVMFGRDAAVVGSVMVTLGTLMSVFALGRIRAEDKERMEKLSEKTQETIVTANALLLLFVIIGDIIAVIVLGAWFAKYVEVFAFDDSTRHTLYKYDSLSNTRMKQMAANTARRQQETPLTCTSIR